MSFSRYTPTITCNVKKLKELNVLKRKLRNAIIAIPSFLGATSVAFFANTALLVAH